jgi:hypothetical protein
VAAPSGLGLDVWVQCNYHVDGLALKVTGRRFTFVPASAELFGSTPQETMTCRRGAPTRAGCEGLMKAFVRFHVRLTLNEGVCRRRPRLGLTLTALGGPECTGNCPAVGFRTITPGPPGRSWMGCGGGGR